MNLGPNLCLIEELEYSESCEDFLRKILCSNIEERITISTALKHPWINGKGGKPRVQKEGHRFKTEESQVQLSTLKIKK